MIITEGILERIIEAFTNWDHCNNIDGRKRKAI